MNILKQIRKPNKNNEDMKTIVTRTFLLLLFLISASFTMNTYAWEWAKAYGGLSDDAGHDIVTDNMGNIYIVGEFTSNSMTLGTTTLQNFGGQDIFIAKFDPLGNVLWAKSTGSNDNDFASSIDIDNFGNLYIVGAFQNNDITFDTVTLKNINWMDMFIIKMNSNGDILWAKSAGGRGDDIPYDVTIDEQGFVYVAGGFQSDTMYVETDTLIQNGRVAAFLIKYDSDGNMIFTKSAGGNLDDRATGVAIDQSGNIYLSGFYESATIDFDAHQLTTFGNFCVFLVKFNSSGVAQWAKGAGGSLYDYGNAVDIDNNGNIYLCGHFSSDNIFFDDQTVNNNASTPGSNDMFLFKFNPNGDAIWGRSAGGEQYEHAFQVRVDMAGNIIVVGNFDSPNISFGATQLTSKGAVDIFVTKFSSNGNVIWSRSAGGQYNEGSFYIITEARGVAVTTDIIGDNVWVTGNASNKVCFGLLQLNNISRQNFFLGKINAQGIGIDENTDKNAFAVYPNPSNNGIFSISSNKAIEEGTEIRIVNTLGKVVYQEIAKTSFNNKEIKIENQAGVYLVQIIGKNAEITTQKLIIH
jgi:hypothetical protein